jgi:galactokinase/mevalonate kinase-like predicted kinase
VALVKALSTYVGRPMSRDEVADTACRIEIDKLEEPMASDQYAAAFGGVNAIHFESGAQGGTPGVASVRQASGSLPYHWSCAAPRRS